MLLSQAEERARRSFNARFARDLLFHETILPLAPNAHNWDDRMPVEVDIRAHPNVARLTSPVEFEQVWVDEKFV